MCGRFTIGAAPEALRDLFHAEGEVPDLPPRWNVAPTQPVAVVVILNEGPRRLRAMRWGLVPSWARDPSIGNRMINARAETLAEKPSFRDPFRRRRCLVVADGFYEWRREGTRKSPVWIHPKDGGVIPLAGIWDRWTSPDGEVVESCAVVTCAANALLAPIHDRMPVILPPAAWDRWLDPAPADPASLADLLVPYPPGLLALRPVSTLVNSPAREGRELIDPRGDHP